MFIFSINLSKYQLCNGQTEVATAGCWERIFINFLTHKSEVANNWVDPTWAGWFDPPES
jgi:hypothetical protein